MTENTILTSSQQKQQEHEEKFQQQQQQPQTYNNNSILISQNRSRRRLKDLNDIITCSICNGYLIEATSINDCLHAFCRSCIVQHLEKQKFCPKCGSNSKQISHSNLRPDNALKALVYKLVPGLYQSECQRVIKYNTENNINTDNNLLLPNKTDNNVDINETSTTTAATATTKTTPEATTLDERYEFNIEANYFSPDEPISLSLEYHPLSIIESGVASTPPIRYLHCPAGVTIQHLCRLIASKYDLNINKNVKIEIIYDGEILKTHFSLMDVAYCFNWTRVSPMRFFYRIFIYPTRTTTGNIQQQNHNNNNNNNKEKENPTSVTHNNKNFQQTNLNRVENATATTHENALQSSNDNKINADDVLAVVVSETKAQKHSSEGKDERKFSVKSARKSIYEAKPQSPEGPNGSSNENSLKLTLVAKKPDPKSKHDSKVKQYKPANDFKRLRSNDMKYSCETAGNSGSSSTNRKSSGGNKTDSVPKNLYAFSTKSSADPITINDRKIDQYNIDEDNDFFPKTKKPENNNRKNEYKIKRETSSNDDLKQQKSINDTNSLNEKLQKALNHHSSTASTDMNTKNQNNLKFKYETISKKCYVNVKKHVFASNTNPEQQQQQQNQSSEYEQTATATTTTMKNKKLDIPKLKIELKNEPSLKTKITVPKQEKKSPDDELRSPNFNSAGSSPSSGSSSTSSTATPSRKLTFKFDSPDNRPSVDKTEYVMNIGLQPVVDKIDSEEVVAVSSHKKRKKAKHSKEPGSKRRKLHAEISSDQNDETLKLKVKITGSKSHKHERKSSSGEAPAKKEKIEELPQIVEEDVIEEKPQIDQICDLDASNKEKEKLLELRSVRHKPMVIIPNLNRSLSEGSSTITNLIKNIQSKAEASRNMAKKDLDLKTLTPPPMSSSFSFAAKKFPNSPSLLLVPPKTPSPHVFKTPTSLTPPPPSPKVSSPNIMDSSQRLTNNSLQNRVFSPRHTPTYPTFNFAKNVPASPRLSPISAPGSGMQISLHNISPKRSSSIDSSPQMMAKQPRLNMMEINAQNRLMKKPVYAPTMTKPPVTIASKLSGQIIPPKVAQNQSPYPFTGGVTRKLAQHSPILAKPITSATKSNDYCFKSSIGTASYTQENLNKKPLPILLPPSSISVTKMTDYVQKLTPAGQIDNRPALEIVAIPHTTSVVDQQKPVAIPVTTFGMFTTTAQNNAKLNVPKTTRPPPSTIPLVKIKRALTLPLTSPMANSPSTLAATVKIPSSPTQSGDRPKNGVDTSPKPVKRANESDGNAPLDLSGKSTRSPTHDTAEEQSSRPIKPTDNGHEKAKPTSPNDIKRVEESLVKKPAPTIPNLTAYKTTSYTTTIPGMPRQLPLPKLNEINKLSTVRQQNPSVRNIPNPSALAFRNQVQPSTTVKTSETNNTSTSVPASACSSAKPLTSFGSLATVSSTFSSITSTSSTVTSTKSSASGMSNLSNNNNSLKSNLQKSNEAQQLVAKKNLNIEQVAAGLRAKSTSANSSVNVV